MDDRLTDTLVAEYNLGYTPCGDRSNDKHRGLQILTSLRTPPKMFGAAKPTTAVVATRGPATEPQALLNAKTELQGVGVAVTSEIHVCAVERGLKYGVNSADWAYVWRILCPEPGPLPEDAPEYGLTIESIPTFADADEDEKVQKLKTTFQRTWAVDVLVDLFALGEQAREREAETKSMEISPGIKSAPRVFGA